MMLGITIGGFVIQALLAWILYARLGIARDDLLLEKQRCKVLQKNNSVLRNQRDNNITTVDDADRVWAREDASRELRVSPDTDPDTQ